MATFERYILYTIRFLVKKRFYLYYAVELVSSTFCDLVCGHWVHDVRSISTWYGVLLTWRVTLYECNNVN